MAAQVVLPCADLDETLDFFTGVLGFRVETISPADDPVVAVIAGTASGCASTRQRPVPRARSGC